MSPAQLQVHSILNLANIGFCISLLVMYKFYHTYYAQKCEEQIITHADFTILLQHLPKRLVSEPEISKLIQFWWTK